LVGHGADGAGDFVDIADAAEGSGGHIAMFEGSGEAGAEVGIIAEPMQKLRESPFGGIDTAAPIDGGQLGAMRSLSNLGGLAPGAVVAPEVVIAEGLQMLVDGDDARPGGV